MPDNSTMPELFPVSDAEEDWTRTRVPAMTDAAMRLLAQQAVTDVVFLTDSPPGIHAFKLVLGLAVPKMQEAFVKDIGGVWEFYANALPRPVNEMPQFTSMNLVSADDMVRVKDLMREIAADLGHPPLPGVPES